MLSRTTHIRRSLLRNIVGIVLLLGGTTLMLTYLGERAEAQRFAESLTEKMLGWTDAQLHALLDPIELKLNGLQQWGERGLLDMGDRHQLNLLLSSFMEHSGWVSSIVLGDSSGREHMILRTDKGWRGREIDVPGQARLTQWQAWDVAPTSELKNVHYDPRERPWYQGALAAIGSPGTEPVRSQYWTQPYRFFTTGDLGMSVAGVFRDPTGELKVIALDVQLKELVRFTSARSVHGGGFISVLSDDGRMLGLPISAEFADHELAQQALLSRPEDFAAMTNVGVLASLLNSEAIQQASPRRILVEGETWWGMVQPFELGPERSLLMAIAVPEDVLLRSIAQLRPWIIWLTLTMVAIAVAIAALLSVRFSRPIEQLVAESERMSRGDLHPGPAIATRLEEIRQLIRAHEKMRVNLLTLLKLEHDLELARQIQQSTYPARLPNLTGYDIAAWCEPADKTGGDSYDVVGIDLTADGSLAGLTDENPQRVALMLADAAGHGFGPALSVLQVRASLRIALRMTTDVSQIITHVNKQLCADLPDGRFVTAWFGMLDADSSTLLSTSTGQAPLLHYRAADEAFDVLSSDAIPLGIFDMGPIQLGVTLELHVGDLFAVISDGIFEARDPQGQLFGVERVQQVLREHAQKSAEECLAALRSTTEAFCAGEVADDDRTIVLIKRT